jgi:lipopolysaccharide export LptBFGC system permease protein LptF
MIYILDLTNPLVLLAALMVYAFLMILGKEYKKSALPAISLIIFLITLGIYGVQMFTSNNADTNKLLATCIGYNSVLVFLAFISYLWVDDMEAKAKNKKSIDDSLDWFWNKV